jgi:hypothetical protein
MDPRLEGPSRVRPASWRSPTLERLDIVTREFSRLFDLPPVVQGHALSPDGRHLAFDAPADGSPRHDIQVCRLDDRSCQIIAAHPADDLMPFWDPDGSLYFSSARNGTYELLRVPMIDGVPTARAELVADYGRRYVRALGIDAHGTLVHHALAPRLDLVRTSLREDTPLERAAGSDVLSTNVAPAWSPTGRLAFISQTGPYTEQDAVFLVIQEENGRELSRLPLAPGVARGLPSMALSWSPDGTRLAVLGLFGDGAPGGPSSSIHLIDPDDGGLLDVFGPVAADGLAGWLDEHTVVHFRRGGLAAHDFEGNEDRVLWRAGPDRRVLGARVSPAADQIAQMATLRLTRHRFHGDWNYTIHPATPRKHLTANS